MVVRDGAWELVDHDVASGRTVWRLVEGGRVHFRTDYPVGAIIDDNARAFNDSLHQRFDDGIGQRVASIPLNVFYGEHLHEAQLQNDAAFIERWLNHPDNRAFRTFKGKL